MFFSSLAEALGHFVYAKWDCGVPLEPYNADHPVIAVSSETAPKELMVGTGQSFASRAKELGNSHASQMH